MPCVFVQTENPLGSLQYGLVCHKIHRNVEEYGEVLSSQSLIIMPRDGP